MKFRQFFKKGALLLLLLFIAVEGISLFAPSAIAPFLPATGGLAEKLAWRLQLYVKKAKGDVPDLSWTEMIQGTLPMLRGVWPGSGFIADWAVNDGSSLHAFVKNPLDDLESIAAGKKLFRTNRAPCHGNDGEGTGHAPSLAKSNYQVGASDLALYKTLRDGIPGTAMPSLPLSLEERWQLTGFLRTLDPGRTNKTSSAQHITPTDISWEMVLAAGSRTDDWLTYSGTLDGWRHSPLGQITSENVSGLKLLWAHQFKTTGNTAFESTPIVANKTIFVTEPPSNVFALDAVDGHEIWQYVRRLPEGIRTCCGTVNRGLAILGNNLYLGTLDGSLVAIDATTGKLKWETHVADPHDGFAITSAPLVVKTTVVVGVAGGEFGIRGFLAAYDANTGNQLWRFDTIPGPGAFGHDSWKNDAWKTGGGPTWVTGSYDPKLNLLYWGVGNPSPEYNAEVRPGDNLFTDSAIALDATTGKLAWHFQFTPQDAHDWDSSQTPVLADLTIDGTPRKVICWANRNGFYYVLDRTNGEFLRGVPFVKVNWASGLDENGRPILTDAAKVTAVGTFTEPWTGGGANWQPPSFDPARQTFLVHATEGYSIYTRQASGVVKPGANGFFMGSAASENPADIAHVVKAIDAATGTIKWSQPVLRRPQTETDQSFSGVMSTDGGIAFSAYAGTVFALDTATGKELWHVNLGPPTKATPVSFILNGKQVVAVTAGKTFFLFGL